MVAITTRHTSKLLNYLKQTYPNLTFAPGDIFYWASSKKTIYYSDINTCDDIYCLLHEVAHAVLDHSTYQLDVILLQLEAEAWAYACNTIAPACNLIIPEDYTQEALDSYRHWLFKRSSCPTCRQTGVQKTKNTYQCLNCRCFWRVNDAKFCALRRRTL